MGTGKWERVSGNGEAGTGKRERVSGITDLSVELHARYLRNRTYYAVNTLDARVDNPDQRIQVYESTPQSTREYPRVPRRVPLKYPGSILRVRCEYH